MNTKEVSQSTNLVVTDLDNDVNKHLWNIANVLRGNMSSSDYMNYILGFIFIRSVSDKVENYADEQLKNDGIKFKNITEQHEQYQDLKEVCLDDIGVFIKPSQLWENLMSNYQNNDGYILIENIENLIFDIEHSNPFGELRGNKELPFNKILSDLDLKSDKLAKIVKEKDKTVYKIMEHISKIKRELFDQYDVLGDAYEYLIGEFASEAGKKGGEFYTPQAIATLLSKIVANGKQKISKAYDPTCGSGSLLLRLKKENEKLTKETNSLIGDTIQFFGQELNTVTYNLARMNMFIHGVKYDSFSIKNENTLSNPAFIENDNLSLVGKCDAIVANPPFSAQWSPTGHENDARFVKYGAFAPKNKADFAFVQHMLHMLSNDGTMAVVVPNGVLFRGGAEGKIRKFLIENEDCLEAVIGLPDNIFFGTSIPSCILVFKKCKQIKGIKFVDASKMFTSQKTKNVLMPEHVKTIFEAYLSETEIENISRLVPIEEIVENDYNLNVSKYLYEEIIHAELNIEEFNAEMTKLQYESNECLKAIYKANEELGISVNLGKVY